MANFVIKVLHTSTISFRSICDSLGSILSRQTLQSIRHRPFGLIHTMYFARTGLHCAKRAVRIRYFQALEFHGAIGSF